jgi:hypothetical protein
MPAAPSRGRSFSIVIRIILYIYKNIFKIFFGVFGFLFFCICHLAQLTCTPSSHTNTYSLMTHVCLSSIARRRRPPRGHRAHTLARRHVPVPRRGRGGRALACGRRAPPTADRRRTASCRAACVGATVVMAIQQSGSSFGCAPRARPLDLGRFPPIEVPFRCVRARRAHRHRPAAFSSNGKRPELAALLTTIPFRELGFGAGRRQRPRSYIEPIPWRMSSNSFKTSCLLISGRLSNSLHGSIQTAASASRLE